MRIASQSRTLGKKKKRNGVASVRLRETLLFLRVIPENRAYEAALPSECELQPPRLFLFSVIPLPLSQTNTL